MAVTPSDADSLPDVSNWDNLSPHYSDLLSRQLELDGVADWLDDWSDLSTAVNEAAAWIFIRYSQDTSDVERKEAHLRYVRDVAPRIRAAEESLRERLLSTGWQAPEMDTVLQRFRTDHRLHRDANLPIQAEEQASSARYSEIVGTATVNIDGEELTLAALAARQSLTDRVERRRAWQARASRMLESREELDDLFEELLGLRQVMAANAGYDSYLDYRWLQLARFDYTPEDGRRFREAILEIVVPALRRQSARRSRMLGLESLRPWDTQVDPRGKTPLRPFADEDELAASSQAMLDRVHPVAGEVMRTLRTEGLLDLANRKGKAPGGYCATLPASGRAFIFMNAVGTDDNLRTVVHEAGHALHAMERQGLRWLWQRRAPMEASELASMSMELLASPYLEKRFGGPYEPADALRSRLGHLERMIEFLPYMATVDGFQDWVYAHPGHGRDERDAAWLDLHQEFCVSADWTGQEESRESLWQDKQHIFRSPLYYIEYGLAQVAALQVWRSSLQDPLGAFDRYRDALALGGTSRLPELYSAAGARLAFDPGTLAELVELVEQTIDQLGRELGVLRTASGGTV